MNEDPIEGGDKLKEFYNKAKEFTKDVGDKISKQATIQKKNLELLKLQDKLAKLYRELGEKAYDYFKKNAPDDAGLKKTLGAVKKLRSEIKGVKIKIGREKAAK